MPEKDGRGASPQKRVMKQNQITRKQETKGTRGILDLLGQLSQVLKSFDGIYNCVLPETDGLTVEAFMEHYGVPRFVTPKGVKKGYTPGLINAAWNENLLIKSGEGKVLGNCVYRNVAAKYIMDEEDKERAFRVYPSEEAALSADGKPITLYKPVQVPCNRWTGKLILKGLDQSKHYEKEAQKAKESAEKWEAVKECWIVLNQGAVRVAKQIDKNRVVF